MSFIFRIATVSVVRFNSKRCDYEAHALISSIPSISFNSKRCDYEFAANTFSSLCNIVSIPKGAIMSFTKFGNTVFRKGFNSKRCDYEACIFSIIASFDSGFNSKRCDYEKDDRVLYVPIGWFQFQKVRL